MKDITFSKQYVTILKIITHIANFFRKRNYIPIIFSMYEKVLIYGLVLILSMSINIMTIGMAKF